MKVGGGSGRASGLWYGTSIVYDAAFHLQLEVVSIWGFQMRPVKFVIALEKCIQNSKTKKDNVKLCNFGYFRTFSRFLFVSV